MKAQRALAIAAAALFVASVAFATAGPAAISLGAALSWIGLTADGRFHDWFARVFGVWAWSRLAQPLLARPAWLPLMALGLVCAGLGLSWPFAGAARRSQRGG